MRTEEATHPGTDMTGAAQASMVPELACPVKPEEKIATPAPIGVNALESTESGHQPGSPFNPVGCHGPSAKTARCRTCPSTPQRLCNGPTTGESQRFARQNCPGPFGPTFTSIGSVATTSPPDPSPQPDVSNIASPSSLNRSQAVALPLASRAQPRIAMVTKTMTIQTPDHVPSARINRGFPTTFQAQLLLDTFALRECGPAAPAVVSTR